MKLKYLFFGIFLLLYFNGYTQKDFFEFANPNYTLQKEKEALYKMDIIYENLKETSPYYIVALLKTYGIDAKKQNIKSIKLKYRYMEFDSIGNLVYASFSKTRFGTEFKYNNRDDLIKVKGYSFPYGNTPFIMTFSYDSINRIHRTDLTIYNNNFKGSILQETYNQYNYDTNNNVARFYYLIPAQISITSKDLPSVQFLYNSTNQLIKVFTNFKISDSIIYYKDSIVKYMYSQNSNLDYRYNNKIDKWGYIFENNNIVQMNMNNKPYRLRKFDERNNLLEEEIREYSGQSYTYINEYKYYPDGRIMRDDLIYNEKGMLTEYLVEKKKYKLSFTYY